MISALVVTRAFLTSVISMAQLGAHVMPLARYWTTMRPFPAGFVALKRNAAVRFLRSTIVFSGPLVLESR